MKGNPAPSRTASGAVEELIDGSTAPSPMAPNWPLGFRAASIACGIKKGETHDLALLVGDAELTAAAVFTRNLVVAAPITRSRGCLTVRHGKVRALLINSGCANAATGPEGAQRAQRSAECIAKVVGCPADAVLSNSTGVIGVQLPVERIEASASALVQSLQAKTCEAFARAIMTTDTRPKWSSRVLRFTHDGKEQSCRVTGVAKGAGMIHPQMATMIAVITTDAHVPADVLNRLLRAAVERSFHRISVDGDTSTNDSVFALASGCVGDVPESDLGEAFTSVAQDLAQMVVRDGEGFERGIEVQVHGARTEANALTVARTVAMSLLVRTAVTGGDPNWGRILAAAGRSGVAFDPARIEVRVGGLPLFDGGSPAATDPTALREAFMQDTVRICIDLREGNFADTFWSCGLTSRYVELNADYTT
ncbi:MAG: bifunctional glutamate N-acetyltransferase/amino-acid acetyltransferase ArgJ [Planctomycetes bacterium]|nr:bifunctional glutamate N-acetyltransferase/amino-acid acetyltransferase ArgJ [Planctomycetota bacterium]